jgi:nitrite reductase/ring-hydroxylating ferredoxin subunit
MAWQKVAVNSDVKEGQGLPVTAPGRKKPIALFRCHGQCFAVADECSHAYAPLSDSDVNDYIIRCSWHGAQFDVRDGKGVGPLAYSQLRTFPVRISGDDIEVDI